jgi:hypothetical protein
MKTLLTLVSAGLLAATFSVTADAATKKEMRKAHSTQESSCKAQAARKYSAIHFMKRRDFVKRCMGTKA